jgi:hypothetical protein
MKEGLKRILGRTGDFLFGGLFILVGIWITDSALFRSYDFLCYPSAFFRRKEDVVKYTSGDTQSNFCTMSASLNFEAVNFI